jgi:hypothetical protein
MTTNNENVEIVLKAKLPVPVSALSPLVDAAKVLYKGELFVLTDHPEAKEWLLIAHDVEAK